MRIFAALRPSEEFRTALSVLQDRFLAAGVTGHYLEPSGLHMTLAFIGEWPDNVTSVLPVVVHPFPIILSHPGLFPKARTLWAGVETSVALDRLAEQVRFNLAEKGIPYDPKEFSPHITLVRKPSIPDGVNLSRIGVPSASMLVEEVCLYRSDHGEHGMEYTVIGSTGKKQENNHEFVCDR